MVEIRYGEQFEISDLAGHTVSEARDHFKSEFGIPDKAKARLNGSKVKAELDTVLNDDDRLTFAVSRGKGAYLIGALLLALAVTGGLLSFKGHDLYIYVDEHCLGLSFGRPSDDFIKKTLREFVEISLMIRDRQYYSTSQRVDYRIPVQTQIRQII